MLLGMWESISRRSRAARREALPIHGKIVGKVAHKQYYRRRQDERPTPSAAPSAMSRRRCQGRRGRRGSLARAGAGGAGGLRGRSMEPEDL